MKGGGQKEKTFQGNNSNQQTHHSWWINLMLPVHTHGWYSGLSRVPSERHTRQISADHTMTNMDM